MAAGLEYVYIGNLLAEDAQNTRCPHCHKLLIERTGTEVMRNDLSAGKCPACKTEIYGIWN